MSRLWAVLRVLGGSAIVFLLYFTLPFSNLDDSSAWLVLAILLTVIVALMVWQVRAIIDANNPRLRAVEALAVSIPLLLVSFSTVHFLVGQSNPAASPNHSRGSIRCTSRSPSFRRWVSATSSAVRNRRASSSPCRCLSTSWCSGSVFVSFSELCKSVENGRRHRRLLRATVNGQHRLTDRLAENRVL